MEYITLRNGLKLPMIGFGTYPLKGDELRDTLQRAYNIGYTLFDSASLYQNEQDIGDCIVRGIMDRSQIILTSKIQGIQFTGRRRYFYLDKVSVAKAYRKACRKFHTDDLDIYLLHSPFKGYTKAYKELIRLYKQNSVKAIGVSNFNEKELDTLFQECGEYPMINQIEVHPYNTMKNTVAYCKEHEIQVEAYSPLGTGKHVGELLEEAVLKQIAENHQVSVPQVVLRWHIQQGIIPIPRSTNSERMFLNTQVFHFALTKDEMSEIDKINKNTGFCSHLQQQQKTMNNYNN